MFLPCAIRRKVGKEHLYGSVVENRRLSDQRVVQRHVLYLGELNGVQESSWRKTVELFGQDEDVPRQVALFPEEHAPAHVGVEEFPVGRVRLSQMALRRPRLMAGLPTVGATRTRRVLARQTSARPRRHALGSSAPDARALPAHRSGERMAAAPALV